MVKRGIDARALGWLVALVGVWLGGAADAAADRIRVEIDKATLVRLEKDADVIFIGNPAVADVTVESPRILFILGLTPGETSLRILDADGADIVATNIVVVPTAERTITVTRNTPNRGGFELTYSCDPRCALVRTPSALEIEALSVGNVTAASAGAGGDSGTLGGEQLAVPAPEPTQ